MVLSIGVAICSIGSAAMAQTKPLSARASDPQTMGWMQGFPPPADKMIRFTDPDYFTFPKLRWTVCHFRELMPTAAVDRGSGASRPLPVAMDPALDRVTFRPAGPNTTMSWGRRSMPIIPTA